MSDAVTKKAAGTLYILHGDDSLAIHRAVKELIGQEGDGKDGLQATVTWLDGNNATSEQMYTAVYTLPFFTGKTRVVITDPILKLQSNDKQEKFIRMLEGLPETTFLVLAVEDELEGYGKKTWWKKMPENSWFGQWANSGHPGCAYKIYKLPEQGAMPKFIQDETEKQGGRISQSAARELADRTGNDTYMASQEITKLLQYVGYDRQIELDDVNQVAASGGTADVFKMTDAIGLGNTREAIHQLHILLEDREPESVFPMIVRQFRLLIQVRAILDELKNPQTVGQKLGLHPYVADKLLAQVRRFSEQELSDIYHRLLKIDWETKVSDTKLDIAMDELIMRLGK